MAGARSLQNGSQKLSIQDFKSKEQDDMNLLNKIIEAAFSQMVKNKLIVLGYEQDELDEVTHEVLHEGVEIYENSDDQSRDIQELNNLEEIHSGLYDRAILMVHFSTALPSLPFSTELLKEAFGKLYPAIMGKPEDNPSKMAQVSSYYLLKLEVSEFVREVAKQSRKMVLIIYGEKIQPGLEMDVMGADIQDILHEVNQSQEYSVPKLPQAVDIVLATKSQVEVFPHSHENMKSMSCTENRYVIPVDSAHINGCIPEQLSETFHAAMTLGDIDVGAKLSSTTGDPWFSCDGPSVLMETEYSI